jgi:hypothetical protein
MRCSKANGFEMASGKEISGENLKMMNHAQDGTPSFLGRKK